MVGPLLVVLGVGVGVNPDNGVRVQWKAGFDNTVPTTPGPRLNIKTVLSTYGDFHVKDKTAVRTSYL